jgi:hypothetical protein
MKTIQLAKRFSGLIVVCILGFSSVALAAPSTVIGTGCSATPVQSSGH